MAVLAAILRMTTTAMRLHHTGEQLAMPGSTTTGGGTQPRRHQRAAPEGWLLPSHA
jgi:hypothetical protein